MLADIDGERGGGEADPEHGSPGEVGRQEAEEEDGEDGGQPPAERPSGLDGAYGSAAVTGADRLADEHGADGPLAAEAQALQSADDEELGEVLREAAEEGEEGEPDDGELQDADAAEAVGGETGGPSSDGGKQRGRGAEQAGLAFADVPEQDKRRQDEAVDHDVEAVEHPAGEGGGEGVAFAGIQVGQPGHWFLGRE
jgi:hypothetical protein